MASRNELEPTAGHAEAADGVRVSLSQSLDNLVSTIVKDSDSAILVTCADDGAGWMRHDLVDVRRAESLGTRETGTHYVEEGEHTSVVADHKLVLLRLQPSQARSTVLDIATR